MLPSTYDARKAFPLFTILAAYFPDAIEALVALSVQGNIQHAVDADAVNPFKLPEDTILWDRSKSTDQLNTMLRHAWDHARAKRGVGSMTDVDGVLHIVKTFWRAGAEAQLTIERLRAQTISVGMPVTGAGIKPGTKIVAVAKSGKRRNPTSRKALMAAIRKGRKPRGKGIRRDG